MTSATRRGTHGKQSPSHTRIPQEHPNSTTQSLTNHPQQPPEISSAGEFPGSLANPSDWVESGARFGKTASKWTKSAAKWKKDATKWNKKSKSWLAKGTKKGDRVGLWADVNAQWAETAAKWSEDVSLF